MEAITRRSALTLGTAVAYLDAAKLGTSYGEVAP
jgi:hypothetical protein